MKKIKKQEGFTLIEVMIVIAIAGLIMVVALIAIPQLQRNQRNNARQSIASRVVTELGNYAGNNNGEVLDSTDEDELDGFYDRYMGCGNAADADDEQTLTACAVDITDPRVGESMIMEQGVTAPTDAPTLDLDDTDQTDGGELGILYYSDGLACDGEDVVDGSTRTFALYTVMEGGAIYCLDNS